MTFKRVLPLLILLALMGVAYVSRVHEYFSLDTLREHRENLLLFVETYPIRAPLLYTLIYAVSTALSIPGAVFLTLSGGFLFPQPFATLYAVTGATLGAVAVFLIAKTAIGDTLRQRAGPRMKKMEQGLHDNAASYLLFLRLVPIFPFWMVNLAPAFFGASLSTYTWTTFLGIIPGAFAFSQAGAGLGAILDSGEKFSVASVLNRDVKIALVALGIVALIPIVLKRFRRA